MILGLLRLATRAATVVTVLNTGYAVYKKGKVVYGAYKKTKQTKSKANQMIDGIKKVVKKK